MIVRAFLIWLMGAALCGAETVRIAVFNTELDRDGPGLLLRDIQRGADDVAAVAAQVRAADADVLLLLRVDYDHGLAALQALNATLGDAAYPHLFALRPNTGWATGLDLDQDGRAGEPEDAQSFGRFAGHNGMAILSRLPIDRDGVRDLSGLLWQDMPDAQMPMTPDGPFWPPEVAAQIRLSTVGHWDVPLILAGGARLHLLAWHGSPPVFDGPEDRNGLRAADEVRLWQHYLDGAFRPPPAGLVVIAGSSNIDPARGDGHHAAMRGLLADPRLQDVEPTSPGASAAGDPTDTVDWSGPNEPGNLRVSYVLPDARARVIDAGVLWPAPGPETDALLGSDGRAGSRHRLVWVTLDASAAP